MMRLAAVFVALCMVLIAGSLGAFLYFAFAFDRLEAAVAAIAALTGLALINAVTARGRARSDLGGQIAELSRGTADLARQVGEIGRKVLTLEAEVGAAATRTRAVTDPLSAEIGELGNLLKELADTVAVHESALLELAEGIPTPAAPAAFADSGEAAELGEPVPEPAAAPVRPLSGPERDKIAALLRAAVDGGRIDLFLQPIVTLPQRKVRYYEATGRLRSEAGGPVAAEDYLLQAEAAGLLPTIDNAVLFRCVQVVRRLLAKNRDIGLFTSVSGDTLVDAEFFPQIQEFLQANRALSTALVFELAQSAVRAMGPLEHESLAALADLGFRFCLSRVGDLRIEPRELSDRGFRFVKVPAVLLLSRAGPAASDIHPADFSDLLGRFGIDLIADRIESEGAVVDLLDFDVRFGQGMLFSAPRPVKPEVLQGLPERPSALRDAPAAGPRTLGEAVLAGREAPPSGEPRGGGERRASALARLARGVVRRA